VDWAILAELQEDAAITNKHLAQRVGLSASACHERVRRLRDAGVVTRIVAEVDPRAVGRPLQAFVGVQLHPPAATSSRPSSQQSGSSLKPSLSTTSRAIRTSSSTSPPPTATIYNASSSTT
jgi:DNA-binding Lrp family transcriptional regulator